MKVKSKSKKQITLHNVLYDNVRIRKADFLWPIWIPLYSEKVTQAQTG